jgi:hypothetical protein
LHDQRGSRVLLQRQQVFMRMQRQQSQWHVHSLRGSEAPGATEEWRML